MRRERHSGLWDAEATVSNGGHVGTTHRRPHASGVRARPEQELVDDRGDLVLIDIESAMYFDVEWEQTFLRLQFGPHYAWFRANDLNDWRLRLYTLALRLSLVARPLRLLDGDYPREMVNWMKCSHP